MMCMIISHAEDNSIIEVNLEALGYNQSQIKYYHSILEIPRYSLSK